MRHIVSKGKFTGQLHIGPSCSNENNLYPGFGVKQKILNKPPDEIKRPAETKKLNHQANLSEIFLINQNESEGTCQFMKYLG